MARCLRHPPRGMTSCRRWSRRRTAMMPCSPMPPMYIVCATVVPRELFPPGWLPAMGRVTSCHIITSSITLFSPSLVEGHARRRHLSTLMSQASIPCHSTSPFRELQLRGDYRHEGLRRQGSRDHRRDHPRIIGCISRSVYILKKRAKTWPSLFFS